MGKARPCRYCENPVASNSKRCPSCGGKHPYVHTPKEYATGCFVVAIAAVAFLTWGVLTKDGRQTRRAQDEALERLRTAPPSATKPHMANPFATAELQFDAARAEDGDRLFSEIISKHSQLAEFYKHVDKRSVNRGFAATIAIPKTAWDALSPEQQQDLGHLMCRESPFNGWSIYVGAIDGSDILADSIVMSSKDWGQHREPDVRYDALADNRDRIARHRALAEGDPGPVTGLAAVLIFGEAKELVRKHLKNPRNAAFMSPSDLSTASVLRLTNGDIEVLGWVDAENSFGASIRTYWTATIRSIGIGEWSLVSLQTDP